MMKLSLILSLALLWGACDPLYFPIAVVNNSADTVYYDLQHDSLIFAMQWEGNAIAPTDTSRPAFVGSMKHWPEEKIEYFPDSAVRAVIYDRPILTKEMVTAEGYTLLEFTFAQLDSMNWTIVYEGGLRE